MPRHVSLPCDELCMRYSRGESTTLLARMYQCSPTTIANTLRRCGMQLRRARFQAMPVPEELLRELYLVQRLPVADIASQLGVSPSTVGNIRRRFGIPVRPRVL